MCSRKMEVGLSDSGMAGGKVVDLVGLCLKLGGVGGGGIQYYLL